MDPQFDQKMVKNVSLFLTIVEQFDQFFGSFFSSPRLFRLFLNFFPRNFHPRQTDSVVSLVLCVPVHTAGILNLVCFLKFLLIKFLNLN